MVLKILVVDDFDRFRALLCLMLHDTARFDVVEASDGLEAVRQAEALQPDLILLDIGLPRLDGFKACRRIRELSPHSKIIFISQESSAEVVQEALRLGGRGYLHKSDVAGELLLAVDAVLKGEEFISSQLRPVVHTRKEEVAGPLLSATLPVPPQISAWKVSGTYFEACNCTAICPCRKQGGMKLTVGSTFGVCDFALSWRILNGAFGDVDLSDRFVVIAGSYRDDEPNKPWRVVLYIDERSSEDQFAALRDIFLGRAGGTALQNFGARIGATYAVRRAAIELDHSPRRWFMRASTWVEVRASRTVPSDLGVTCGIPGHDQPGNELIVDALSVHDEPLDFDLRGRCGFQSNFDYSSHFTVQPY
jgi:DNA-binding NarL/FixJ family response regulator